MRVVFLIECIPHLHREIVAYLLDPTLIGFNLLLSSFFEFLKRALSRYNALFYKTMH